MAGKIRKLVRIALIAGLILALGAGSAFAAGFGAWINDSNAKIYTSTGESGTLHAGTKVRVTAAKKGWAQISYKDNVGYVPIQYLTSAKGITGYVNKSNAYIYKEADKSSAKIGPLELGMELKVVGVSGKFFQVTNGKQLGYIAKGALSKKKPSEAALIASKVELVDWSKADKALPKGKDAYLYDIQSGLTVHVHRLGGSKHMELEPATAEDTAKLLKMDGGAFSWNSRPVILNVNGKLLAAAINTMPHGEQTIKNNNFNGQFCMHFPGSKTHGSDSVNTKHQAAIKYAYKWAQANAK